MASLVDYSSSDEEQKDECLVWPSTNNSLRDHITKKETPHSIEIATSLPIGPILGPPQSNVDMSKPFLEDNLAPHSPYSPYSANRALLRDLTLPTLPNYEIPPLPLGSPIPNTESKFLRFLELKQQGVHFNGKLSKSSALKNPSLMQKLMSFANIDDVGQCSTTLAKELWNSDSFPASAYKEELAKSQQLILKRRMTTRGVVDFVPAMETIDVSKNGSLSTSQKSAAERIMAGLEGRANTQQVSKRRKTRFDL